MGNFTLRTEDLTSEEIEKLYVDTKHDRENIEFLKSNSAGLLIGSRGTGKTMLLRMAERELINSYIENKIVPVFVSFSSAALVKNEEELFKNWMLSKILFSLQNQLQKLKLLKTQNIFSALFGNDTDKTDELSVFIESYIKQLENSWKNSQYCIGESISNIFDIDYFKKFVHSICEKFKIKQIIILFDEACHNFMPKQQRVFFTLFRDLRSPNLCCKAAVYPGITSYGTFEIFHDAVVKRVEKDILAHDYVEKMRDIIEKQIGKECYEKLATKGELLDALIYAASGNPRMLLKSVYEASEKLNGLKLANVNSTIKDFYRVKIWSEYTKLGDKFKEYKKIIDWGRSFVEEKLLIETHNKNKRSENEDEYTKQTIYFILHKDAPETVKKAINILEYAGIVVLHTEGYKTRGNIYNRYQINLGVTVASTSEKELVTYISKIKKGLSIKTLTEYGANSIAFGDLPQIKSDFDFDNCALDMQWLLDESVDILDITGYQKDELKKLGFNKLYDILNATEQDLQKAPYIGPVKSRRIVNLATHALFEFIAG